MAKFDKMIKKVNEAKVRTVEEYMDTLTALEEMRDAIKEGVDHYGNQELLNDPLQYWYTNARAHYENKFDQIENAILVLKGKIGGVQGTVKPESIKGDSVTATPGGFDASPQA